MIEKRINGGNYQPVMTDKLVLDSTPTVNSLNGVTSDAVARAVAGASGEVPVVEERNNGQFLQAIYDEHGPAVSWADAPDELPPTTGHQQGDVLTIGESGFDWATPSAGGGGFSPTLVATASLADGTGTVKSAFTFESGASMTAGWYVLEVNGYNASGVTNPCLSAGIGYDDDFGYFVPYASGAVGLIQGSDVKYLHSKILLSVPYAITGRTIKVVLNGQSDASYTLESAKLYAL